VYPRRPTRVPRRCLISSRPQLCQSVSRPPTGTGWLHEIKSDGYRVQLRVQNGKVSLKTRKGLDWTAKFRVIAEEAASLPDTIIDGEIVALNENGAPNFAALQAALSEQTPAIWSSTSLISYSKARATYGRYRSGRTDSWTKAKCRAVGRVGTGFKRLLPRLKAVGATKSSFTGVSAPRNEPWPDIMPSMGSP
jgi:ATP-dependent DNA ligase